MSRLHGYFDHCFFSQWFTALHLFSTFFHCLFTIRSAAMGLLHGGYPLPWLFRLPFITYMAPLVAYGCVVPHVQCSVSAQRIALVLYLLTSSFKIFAPGFGFFLLFLRRLVSPFFFNKIFFFVLTNPKLQGLDPSSLGAPDFDRKGKERNVGIYVLATRWRMNRVAPYPPFLLLWSRKCRYLYSINIRVETWIEAVYTYELWWEWIMGCTCSTPLSKFTSFPICLRQIQTLGTCAIVLT